MTTRLAPASEANPVSQTNPPPPVSSAEARPAAPRQILVQLALKIELPTNDIDSFKSSGAIVISLTPA